MTLEELKQAAAESSPKEIVMEEIEIGNFDDNDINNYIEILGENGEQILSEILQEQAFFAYEQTPNDENTVRLFIKAGYDLDNILLFIKERIYGYNQIREADVFCAELAEAYIQGKFGLQKDNHKAWKVFEFLTDISGAWTDNQRIYTHPQIDMGENGALFRGNWHNIYSASLERILINYMKGIFDDDTIDQAITKIADAHFAGCKGIYGVSNIYIIHQFLVGRAKENMDNHTFNKYVNNFIEGDEYVQAREILEERAEAGDSIAQYNLGYCYDIGLGTKKNHDKLFHWYQKSAKQNNTFALLRLALCYSQGIGTTKNPQESTKIWEHLLPMWEQLAEEGDTSAMVNIGIAYYEGTGCEANHTKAKSCFQEAADLGNKGAVSYLNKFERAQESSSSNNSGCLGMLIALIALSSSFLFAFCAFVL